MSRTRMNTRVRPPLAFAGGLAAAALSAAALCAAPALAQTPASPSQPAAGTPSIHAYHPRLSPTPITRAPAHCPGARCKTT